MIKEIRKLKNFGIFSDLQKSERVPFNDKNIIYGWNYSGKTTISRFFNFLNANVQLPEDYNDVEFEVILDDGTTITKDNRSTSPLSVKVFNTDFIEENISFNSSLKKTKGIAFDVGTDSIDKRKEISKNDEKIEKAKSLKEKYQNKIDQFNEFENSKFTNCAKFIKNDILNSVIDFTKAHFKKVLDSVIKNLKEHILDDNVVSSEKAIAIAKAPKEKINITQPNCSYSDLANKVKILIEKEPIKTEDNELLSSNKDLYDWVRDGVEIYNGKKDDSLKICAFCGSTLDSNLLPSLNAFYSNEAAKVMREIESIKKEIENEKITIDTHKIFSIGKNDFEGDLFQKYESELKDVNTIKKNYFSLLEKLSSTLDLKVKNMFVKADMPKQDITALATLNTLLSKIQTVISEHNTIVGSFESNQNSAREKVKKHYVAKFLKDENYLGKKRSNNIVIKFFDSCDRIINHYKSENTKLEAELKSFAKGKEALNEFIQKFLNRSDIAIELEEDSFFVLKRNGREAKNLSEGEKTAIAFSYFMVMLESLMTDNKLKDTIVFIDDPISSLDANHIAQVSSYLNSFFFRKEDPATPDKIVNCFKQLFISTHNFEFYSFISDANNIKRLKKNPNYNPSDATKGQKKISACNFYMIKRIDENTSSFINAPTTFTEYKSEYVFLFAEIYAFHKANCSEKKSYYMPNIVRRFLEIYTLIKLPGNRGEIDNRVKLLIGEVSELKILHTFSHLTSFDRALKHSELVSKIPDIVDEVIIFIKKDKDHFNSLCEGIGEKERVI